MPAFLNSIEIENFKSYKGKFVIGPLKSFTAVVGPNGSGKSNFMDAISFVMGEKSSSMRVRRLSDLIHGASIGKPVSNIATVTAVFNLEDGSEQRFVRKVQDSSSDYQINDNGVTSVDYLAELEKLGINVKSKNFLVFQGSVESIAMKNPKQLTALFEEISGSRTFKAEYDRLKAEMLDAEEAVHISYHKKKGITVEKKEAKLEKREAENYQRLEEEYAKKNIVMQLFCLYHNEKALENLGVVRQGKRQELENLEGRKQVAEQLLRDQKKEAGRIFRVLASMDQQIREAEVEITKRKPTLIKTKEHVAYLRAKVESNRKCLDQARAAATVHKNEIRELEEELHKIELAKTNYDAINVQEKAQSHSVQLGDEQIREYNRLKEEAGKASAVNLQKLDSIKRLLKSDQDKLENEIRMKTDLENRIKQISHMQDEAKKREEKLIEFLVSTRAKLEEYQKRKSDLQSSINTSEDRVGTLQRELTNICEQLGNATLDTNELARMKKKAQLVKVLKDLFPGVYDRMLNMCEPTHKRYNIAVTKVFGKFMDAIVVDTEETARQCIKYLKEQCLEPETFLPIGYIQVEPLKERLRMIKEPRNVKLLFDVIKFQPRDIERAILFVTRNTLVCETSEDASIVAYDLDSTTRYSCVALDGTFHQKSGIMSGGSFDLARRAKRWDEKQIAQLELQKKKLSKELKEALLESRKNDELRGIVLQIDSTENRLKYIDVDLKLVRNHISQYEAELKDLQSELEKLKPTIADIEESIANKNLEVDKIKQEINNREDNLFKDFCVKIGVSNIREYEERELLVQRDRENKRMDFDNQCNRISNQLDFERQRDTESNISRWENNLKEAEIKLESASQVEAQLKEEIRRDEVKAEELKVTRNAKKEEANLKREEIDNFKHQVTKLADDILSLQRQLNGIESKIDRRKAERHTILVNCKVGGIEIPILDGNIGDVMDEISPPDDDGAHIDSTQEVYERESRLAIDYGLLADELKGIEGDDIERTADTLRKTLNGIQSTLHKIHAPNMKADEKLAMTMTKFQETFREYEATRKNATKVKKLFERVRNERRDRFLTYFEHVAKEIDPTYKGLTRDVAGHAFLEPENPEEPYLAGINYHCVVPGKRFRPMSNLSGGEKTVAALALLFAIQSMKPAPFFVLDEIDAALDNTNTSKVARYIREKTNSLQTIVISLKEDFYSHAEALIGISPEAGECMRSHVLTVDLTAYQHY